MKKLFTLLAALACVLTVGAAADMECNFSADAWQALTYSNDTTVGSFTVKATTSKTVTVTSSSKTVDGVSYTKVLKFGGTGSTTNRCVTFSVTGPCDIYVVGGTASNGTERVLYAYNGSAVFDSLATSETAVSDTLHYTGTSATLYLYSKNSGFNLYDIQVFYTSSDGSSDGGDGDDDSDGDDTTTSTSGVIASFTHISASLSSSSGSLTASSSEFTVGGSCTFSWSGMNAKSDVKALDTTTGDSVYCYKMNSNDAYYKFALTSGSFQAGDVVTVTGSSNGSTSSKDMGAYINSTSGNKVSTSVTQGTLATATYTLTESDLATDGTLTFYRVGSNSRIYSIAVTRATTTIERSTSQSGWATYSHSTEKVVIPEGVTAYEAKYDDSNSVVQLTKVGEAGGILPANTGFILKGTGSSTIELTVTDSDATVTVSESNELTPTGDSGYTVEEKSDSAVYGLASDDLLHPVTASTTMPANGAYIVLPTNNTASAVAMSITDDEPATDGDTTGISNVAATTATDGTFYNLQGMRVSQPTRGLYIVNGKKVIIR